MQQLEHQVKELENIIKKRFPNSLSALILSSGVAEGQTKARCIQDLVQPHSQTHQYFQCATLKIWKLGLGMRLSMYM